MEWLVHVVYVSMAPVFLLTLSIFLFLWSTSSEQAPFNLRDLPAGRDLLLWLYTPRSTYLLLLASPLVRFVLLRIHIP